MHITDVDVVVEIECARGLRRNLFVLKTRLGEDQRLRTDRHTELLQDRFQIALLLVVSELNLASIQTLL